MRRLLPGLVAAALLVAPTAACRSKPADEQTLRDLGVTSSTAAATSTSGSTPRPEEDGPPTTRRSTTTSSAKGTTTTGASDLTELAGDVAAADALLQRLAIPLVAPSLGGPETLITRPATTSHAGLARDVRLRQGIADHLIRISVGLEATADLIEDFSAALA